MKHMLPLVMLMTIIMVTGSSLNGQITIDGDMLDWAGISAADAGNAAEALGDMPTGAEFDLLDLYITSDEDYIYCRIDIDPSATFTAGFTGYTNAPILEFWFDVDMGDTTGLGWGGFWIQAGDYKVSLEGAYDPDGPSSTLPVYKFIGDWEGAVEDFDSVGLAMVAINDDDNSMEFAVPRAAINAGTNVRPFVYSVGDELWDNEEYLPDDEINDEGPSYTIDYSLVTKAASAVQVRGEQIVDEIVIDGDMLDWAGISAADAGNAAEELGDMPTGAEFDLQDLFLGSDSDYIYVRLDIDPSATFTAGFTGYTNAPILEFWFDTEIGDTSGLGWGGFWIQAGDYKVSLEGAYDPDGPSSTLPVYKFIGDWEGAVEDFDSVGLAMVAINDDDNSMELAIPRAAINAGPYVRPFVYSVGDELWDNEEYLPDDEIDEVGPSYTIEYDFISGSSVIQVKPGLVGIEDEVRTNVPGRFVLGQNYPNPFNPETRIDYNINVGGYANLSVYNLLGQKIATLFEGERVSGRYTASWNGKDIEGHLVASGIYLYRLDTENDASYTKKMLLLK